VISETHSDNPPVRPLGIATLRRLCALGVPALLLALAACTKERDTVPVSCVREHAGLMAALRQAPATVVLADGTRLSRCVSTARTDAELQSLGHSFGRAADALRVRAQSDASAALQLGYLAGAVRTGARRASSGIADQLARRMQQLATLAPGASAAATAALTRGLREGERRG